MSHECHSCLNMEETRNQNGTTRQTINAIVYPSAMAKDQDAAYAESMSIILAITVFVIIFSLPQGRQFFHLIYQRWDRLEEEEEDDDELEEGDLLRIVSLIDWLSWAQENIERGLYLIITSACYTTEHIRDSCGQFFLLGDYKISDGIRSYSRMPFGKDTSPMPPLEEARVREDLNVAENKEGDDHNENLPNRKATVSKIDFSTDIEPAFLNDCDYPDGWLVYDPLRGLVPKEVDRLLKKR